MLGWFEDKWWLEVIELDVSSAVAEEGCRRIARRRIDDRRSTRPRTFERRAIHHSPAVARTGCLGDGNAAVNREPFRLYPGISFLPRFPRRLMEVAARDHECGESKWDEEES